MDIQYGVGAGEHLFGEGVGDALGPGAVPDSGEHAVQVLAVAGADIHGPPEERRQVGDVHHHHRSRNLGGIEQSLQAPERQDGGVFRAVDSGHERQHRARPRSVDDRQGEEGPGVGSVLGGRDLEPTRHLPAPVRFEVPDPESVLRGAAGGAQETEEGGGQGSHGRFSRFRGAPGFGERADSGGMIRGSALFGEGSARGGFRSRTPAPAEA